MTRHQPSRLDTTEDLQPPTCIQDTTTTQSIYYVYEEALYPTLTRLGLDKVVEDNSPVLNSHQSIRDCHRTHGVRIVGRTRKRSTSAA